MNKVYLVKHDYDHSGENERDAFHIPFVGVESIGVIMNGVENSELPSKISFQANFKLIDDYDYPLTDLTIPIMSDRMIKIFKSLDDLKLRFINVVMIDDLSCEIISKKDFFAIQIMEYTDAFDYENSEYRMRRGRNKKVGVISKLRLREPENGFPSIFRIKESSSKLFINSKAKEALEKENIKGCVYEPVVVSEKI